MSRNQTTTPFAAGLKRGLILLLISLLSYRYKTGCESPRTDFRLIFIYGQAIYYVLFLINTGIRKVSFCHRGFAVFFHSMLVYATGALALEHVLRQTEILTMQTCMISIMAYVFAIHFLVRLFFDVSEMVVSCSHRNSNIDETRGNHVCDLAALSSLVALLRNFNISTCDDVSMITVDIVYTTLLVFLGFNGILMVLRFCEEGETIENFLTGVICLKIFWLLALFIGMTFVFARSDCAQRAPYIDFIFAGILWGWLVRAILAVVLAIVYQFLPGIDEWKTSKPLSSTVVDYV
eukprot:TRINITY_DN11314_c0_g1_i1.p1 TRINITY_DN11314_c0_g1~~TRINITY_DN11314_c0_g1_i1.p1  ORF type:complete len:292 (-),score=12.44 TRINITY_DN11314_c0_g1_i1:185-1060(-)